MTRSRVDSVNSFPVSHRCLRLANEPSCYTLNGHRRGSSNDLTHYHMTYIMEDGRVLVTGTNSNNSVPLDSGNDPAVCVEVNFAVGAGFDDQLIGKPVAAIQSYLLTAILTDRGDVALYGYNGHGQLGRGNTTASAYAVPIDGTNITPRSNIANRHIVKIDITKGYPSVSNAIWALAADGTVWGWGNNANGTLAQGNTTNQSSPVQLQYTGGTLVDDAVDIFLGHNNVRYGYILNEDGELWGVGDNSDGQLADGTTTQRTQLVQCTGLPAGLTPSDFKYVLISGGRIDATLVLLTDGRMYMAGQNTYYLNGDSSSNADVTTFTEITYPTGTTSVQDAWMAGEYSQAFLYTNDNRLYAIGYNGNGQLGIGNTSTPLEYTEVTSNGEVDFAASDGGSAIGTNFTGGYVEYGKWKPIHISAGGSYAAPTHYHCVAMLGNDGHSYSAGYYGGYGTRDTGTTRTIFQRHRIPNSAYEVRGVFEDDGGSIADRPHYDNMIPAQGPDREIMWKPAALVSHGYTSQWACFLRLENGAVYAIGRSSGNKLGTVSTSANNSTLGWRRVKLELA